MEKINITNFEAYKDKGNFTNYKDTQMLDQYRNQNLEKNWPAIDFIKTHVSDNSLKIIDIGSGYSSLLYELENQEILKKGIAVESSKASYEFAEKWKKDCGFKKVTNINDNALNVMYPHGIDLFSIIDGTFALLYPENKNFPNRILGKAYASLKKNGRLLLELVNFYPVAIAGEVQHWKEFEPTDPFRYGLYKEEYNKDTNIIKRKSTYIHKDWTVSEKTELVYFYTVSELTVLLEENNFKSIYTYGDFKGTPFKAGISPRLIVLASKTHG